MAGTRRRSTIVICSILLITVFTILFNVLRTSHRNRSWATWCDKMQARWEQLAAGDAVPVSPEYPTGFGDIEQVHQAAAKIARYYSSMSQKFRDTAWRPFIQVRFEPLDRDLERLMQPELSTLLHVTHLTDVDTTTFPPEFRVAP
jgi:hypothetical protein